jgi:D-erythro-7,8-dihydroneopterin triphosphate epimerase
MAVIHINDLKVRTIIGINPDERVNKQDLMINVTLEYDANKASKSDSIKDALDYHALSNALMRIAERSRYKLLEKLAAKLLEAIMADKRVTSAAVRLDKPQAIPEAKCVSFEVWAQR